MHLWTIVDRCAHCVHSSACKHGYAVCTMGAVSTCVRLWAGFAWLHGRVVYWVHGRSVVSYDMGIVPGSVVVIVEGCWL